MSELKTFRVKTYVRGYQPWEVDAESEDAAREEFSFGVLVYDDLDDEVEDVTQIDMADTEA